MNGPFVHRRSEDGCSLIIEEIRTEGIYTTTLEWPTRRDADKNWEQALVGYHAKAIGSELQQVGQSQRTIKLGHGWYLAVLAGPPTWWLPRVSVRRWQIMIGWLRRGYVLTHVAKPAAGESGPQQRIGPPFPKHQI